MYCYCHYSLLYSKRCSGIHDVGAIEKMYENVQGKGNGRAICTGHDHVQKDGESGMGELGESDDFVEFLVSSTDAGAD